MNKSFKKINNKWSNIEKFKNLYNSYKSYIKLLLILFNLLLSYNIRNGDTNDIYQGNNLIRIAYYCVSIKYGGVERVISILINYLSKEKIFSHYLITESGILEGEYSLPNKTKRIILSKGSLLRIINKNRIDILIYNFYNKREIVKLNRLKSTKIIYYDHSSFLLWIYSKKYNFKKTVYNVYRKCKYVISLIPVENDYLFKKWGINSILMDNPTSFEYDSVVPSDLNSKNIIMIGRAGDPSKRFDLGIKSMQSIIKEIKLCQMNIISTPTESYEKLILDLKIEKNVRFIGFHKKIEDYLKNSSLHILTSLSESYSMALGETKLYGIPSIICGLDYLTLAKGGTVIIYDDNPDNIAKVAIKILKNKKYRKQLGKEARESMKKCKNELIMKKWVKLLLSVYRGDDKYYQKLFSNEENKIN